MINLRTTKYRRESNILYEKMFDEWVKEAQPEVGDKFKVLRKSTPYEVFNDYWTDEMDKAVGNTLELTSCLGHTLKLDGGYNYPFYVLEKVEPPKAKDLKLSELNGRLVRYENGKGEFVNIVFRQVSMGKYVAFEGEDWNRFNDTVHLAGEFVPSHIGNYTGWKLVGFVD